MDRTQRCNMNTISIIIITFIIIGGVVSLILVGLRSSGRIQGDEIDPIMERLAEATQRGESVSLEQMEMQQPFSERVIVPIMDKLGEISTRFTPHNILQDTMLKLELAGNPGGIGVVTFLAIRFVIAAVFGGGLWMTSLLSATDWPLERTIFVISLFTVIGYFYPNLWLQSRINSRQYEIRKALPGVLDLLTICEEAGLGFDTAMSKVAEKREDELSLIFGRTIREVQLGKTQREALRDMAFRIGLPELTSFVASVIQSQQLGVSLAKTLRIQSDHIYAEQKERVLNELSSIDNWNKTLFFILFGPVFVLWFTWPILLQILSASPK
jgi:tight adherence protein C